MKALHGPRVGGRQRLGPATGGTYAGTVPMSSARRALLRCGAGALGVLLAVGLGSAPAGAASGRTVPGTTGTTTAADDGAHRSAVVVIGTAGLRWDDLDPATTPALWRLAENGAVGSLVTRSVRTASCPADGWLALGAGNRAADAPPTEACRALEDPGADGAVPRWDVYLVERDAHTYGSILGLLGSLLEAHGLEAFGVGPGAAVALASPDGTVVGEHLPWPEDPAELGPTVAGAVAVKDLVIVDAGAVLDHGAHDDPARDDAALGDPTHDSAEPSVDLTDDAAARAAQVAAVETRVAAVVGALDGSDAPTLLASLADGGPEPRLQVLALQGFPGVAQDPSGQVLVTGATRQPGYVLTTDLLPTLLDALLAAPSDPDREDFVPSQGAKSSGQLIGSVARGIAAGGSGGERVDGMVELDRHAGAIRTLTPGFFALLIAVNLALYAAVWLRMFGRLRNRVAALRWFRVAGVVVGALPVATFLANLAPWWRADPSGLGLYLGVGAGAALVAGAALLGPWRRSPLGPLTVVAAVTALTITLDVLTGSRLQLGSPMGVHPLVAGRFYGLNNSAFALLMVSSLLVAGVVGSALVARGRRGWGVAAVAAVGVVVTAVDGLPGLGADFGGPPALVPAFAVLALHVAGVRVGWRRLVVVLGAGLVVVTTFAVADWLRPEADRTHLGRFVQTVLDGGLLDVIGRKLAQNFTILTSSWLALLVVAGVGLVLWLVGRPRRWAGLEGSRGRGVAGVARDDGGQARGAGVLAAAGAQFPALRATLPAAATGLAIGFAVNDSGIVIPAIGMSLALPLVVATLAAWLGTRPGWPMATGSPGDASVPGEADDADDFRGAAATSG